MAKKPNIIENVSFTFSQIPNLLGGSTSPQPYSAIQTVYIDALTGDSVVQAETAAAAFNSRANAGNPSISSSLEVKTTRLRMLWDGAALGVVIWGRTDQLSGSSRLPSPTKWSAPFKVNINRFITQGTTSTIAAIGTAVVKNAAGFPHLSYEVPASRIFVQEASKTSFAANELDENAGKFVTLSGVSSGQVLRLVSDVKEYDLGNSIIFIRTKIYEQRSILTTGGGQTIDGWEQHTVGADSKVIGLNLRTG